MGHSDDLILVEALIRRDPAAVEAFESRVRRILQRCLARARARYPRAIADDADLIQSFFVLLYKDDAKLLAGYRGEAALTTWIHAIAVRHFSAELARAHARDAQREPEGEAALGALVDGARTPEEARAEVEERDRLRRALAELSPEDRLLIQLLIFEEAPPKVVAATLGISAGGVRMRKLRALERLTAALEKK